MAGETQFPVPPLTFEHRDEPAVALFVQRAKLVRPSFDLGSEDVEAVRRICQRVDGIPLAIELTAAASRLLSPAELVNELDSVLDLPTEGPRDAPAHQRTVRAAIDWSYQLLEEAERAVFARLGVFVAGFALESAGAVCALDGLDRPAVFAGVAALVSKSLVETGPDGRGRSRFHLLETIRAYAIERLEQSPENEVVRRRHAVHYRT